MKWELHYRLTDEDDGRRPSSGHVKKSPDQFLPLPNKLGGQGGGGHVEQGVVLQLASQASYQHSLPVARWPKQEKAPRRCPLPRFYFWTLFQRIFRRYPHHFLNF